MEDRDLIRCAGIIMATYKNCKKNDASGFISKKDLKNMVLESEFHAADNKSLNKIIRITGFKEAFRKHEGRTQRGYWVKEQDEIIDLSKIQINKYKLKTDIVILNNDQETIDYITNNWADFEPFMSNELKILHASDPKFINASAQKIKRLFKLAGFATKNVFYPENRHKFLEPIKQTKRKLAKNDINRLLRPELFD